MALHPCFQPASLYSPPHSPTLIYRFCSQLSLPDSYHLLALKPDPNKSPISLLLMIKTTCVFFRAQLASLEHVGFFFFFNVALRQRKRDGLLGKGTTEWRLDRGYRPKKTGETVDRRQNNGSVKAVSPRHCPATCCFNCCAWTESQRQWPLHFDNSKQKKSNFRSPAPPPSSWSLLG